MRSLVAGVLVLAVATLGLVAWRESTAEDAAKRVVQVQLGDASIVADIVDTPTLRAQGLSGRASLSETEGMLFVFEEDADHAFWMKDMRFAIDMIWLSTDKRVVHIVSRASPESYPASFSAGQSSRYVLEVPAGWSERHGVAVGSIARF